MVGVTLRSESPCRDSDRVKGHECFYNIRGCDDVPGVVPSSAQKMAVLLMSVCCAMQRKPANGLSREGSCTMTTHGQDAKVPVRWEQAGDTNQ